MEQAFPALSVHDLTGEAHVLPEPFVGRVNAAIIAFDRHHQVLVDAWLRALRARFGPDQLQCYEIPSIARRWKPVRLFIDGGMAAAIVDPVVLRATFTYYGDLSKVTEPLGLDTRTVAAVIVDDLGVVRHVHVGEATAEAASEVGDAIDEVLRASAS